MSLGLPMLVVMQAYTIFSVLQPPWVLLITSYDGPLATAHTAVADAFTPG